MGIAKAGWTVAGESIIILHGVAVAIFIALIYSNVRGMEGNQPNRIALNRWIRVAVILIIIIIAALYLAVTPTLVQLWIEGIYRFDNAFATYHFEIANPLLPEEMMYLDIALSSTKPSIMSHTTINSKVVLYPNDEWRAKYNTTDDSLPNFFYLIYSGSDCRQKSTPQFRLDDGTCVLPLSKDDFGNYRNNSYDYQYKSAGDFPVLLSTDAFFEGNVTRSVEQYIVVSGYENYLSILYAHSAIIVSIFAFVGIVVFEIILRYLDRPRR
jgi:hypothetical protein